MPPGFKAAQRLLVLLKAELSVFSSTHVPEQPLGELGLSGETQSLKKLSASPSTVRVAFAETLPALF